MKLRIVSVLAACVIRVIWRKCETLKSHTCREPVHACVSSSGLMRALSSLQSSRWRTHGRISALCHSSRWVADTKLQEKTWISDNFHLESRLSHKCRTIFTRVFQHSRLSCDLNVDNFLHFLTHRHELETTVTTVTFLLWEKISQDHFVFEAWDSHRRLTRFRNSQYVYMHSVMRLQPQRNLEHAPNAKSHCDPVECLHAAEIQWSIQLSRCVNPTFTNPIQSDFSQAKMFTSVWKVQS